MDYLTFFALDALVVLALAITIGYFFSYRKAKKAGQKLMTPSSMKLLSNFLIPLLTGGIFCIMLAKHNGFGFIAPSMLIFYGLALINGSKYIFQTILKILRQKSHELCQKNMILWLHDEITSQWLMAYKQVHEKLTPSHQQMIS